MSTSMHYNFQASLNKMWVILSICRRQGGVVSHNSPAPRDARGATAVEVAAELREVYCGCPGRGAVEAEISGCRRSPGLLHAGKRGEDGLLVSNGG